MRRAPRDLLLLLGALALCPMAAFIIGHDPSGPLRRAEALVDAERALGLHPEPAMHRWTLGHPALMTLAGLIYVFAHIGVAGWALVWTWCLRRDAFARVRDTFLWTQVLTVSLYVSIPTAPPRLLPGAGYHDTFTGLWGREVADSAHLLQSPFAAMPSGHVAFALVAGGTFALLGDQRWLRAFGWLYPPLILLVTVVAGHHLWLDAAGAAVVVAVAARLAGAHRSQRAGADDLLPPGDLRVVGARHQPAPRLALQLAGRADHEDRAGRRVAAVGEDDQRAGAIPTRA